MVLVLIIAGAIWFSLSLIFVLALMGAARLGIPPAVQPGTEPVIDAERDAQAELPCVSIEESAGSTGEVLEPITVPSGIALASIQSPIGMPE